jgi:hypothetical protein
MLHLRGLVDLGLLWPAVTGESRHRVEELAEQVGVLRATRLLADVLQSDLGVTLPALDVLPGGWRSRCARRMLDPVRWCVWASRAAATEFVAINPARMRRRMLMLDHLRDAAGLVGDALFPPREYLAWRWPGARSLAAARVRHLTRVAGKWS